MKLKGSVAIDIECMNCNRSHQIDFGGAEFNIVKKKGRRNLYSVEKSGGCSCSNEIFVKSLFWGRPPMRISNESCIIITTGCYMVSTSQNLYYELESI